MRLSFKNKMLFMVVSFLLWFPHFLYVPILSPYLNRNHVSYTFIGVVLGSYGVMQMILRVPIGVGADILKNKKIFIVFGMFSSFVSCVLFIIAQNEWWFLLARTLAGAGAASWVAFTIMYLSFFSPDKVATAMGSISFIIVLAQYTSMSISGVIVSNLGWEFPFYIAALFSFIGLLLTFTIQEYKNPDDKNNEPMRINDIPSVIKNKNLIKTAILSIIAHSIMFATIFGFMPDIALHIGFQENSLFFIVSVFMIPHAIATLLVGNVIIPKLGIYKSLFFSFLIVLLSLILTPIFINKIPFIIFQAFTGFGLGVIFPVLLGLPIQSISFEKRSTAMGVYQSLYALGIFLGPYISGVINSIFNLWSGYYFLSVLSVLGVLLTYLWFKKIPHNNKIVIIYFKSSNLKKKDYEA